jgi:hypothetical protein
MATPITIRGTDNRKGIRVTGKPGEGRSSLSIALNDTTPGAVWAFDVEAERVDGFLVHVGRMLSIAPSVSRKRSRLLALAYCPGAVGWLVTPELVDVVGASRLSFNQVAAELTLAVDTAPAGGGPALLPSPGLATLTPQAPDVYESGYAAEGTISAVSCAVGAGAGWIQGYAASTLVVPAWVFLFDLAAPPAVATAPAIQPIRLRASQTFSLDSVRLFRNGLSWAGSLSDTALTTSGADFWLSALVERR